MPLYTAPADTSPSLFIDGKACAYDVHHNPLRLDPTYGVPPTLYGDVPVTLRVAVAGASTLPGIIREQDRIAVPFYLLTIAPRR